MLNDIECLHPTLIINKSEADFSQGSDKDKHIFFFVWPT